MTEILKKSIELLFISILVSVVFAPIMISFLYKFNQVSGIKKSKIGGGEGDNTLFMKIMKTATTNGTPNMGGLMILVIVPILVYFCTSNRSSESIPNWIRPLWNMGIIDVVSLQMV